MNAVPTEKQQKKSGRGSHPNSRANLRTAPPFKKGTSGNPGGQQKGAIYISEAYKRLMAMSLDELQAYKPINAAEEMAKRQINRALMDEHPQAVATVEKIADRTEGKPKQQVEQNVSGTLTIEYVNDWRKRENTTP